jgi:two-component system, cell cycle response regulator
MVGYNIFPIGFSSYEKSTIETFFRLAGRRAPHWALTARSTEARVILFNAGSQQEVDAFRSIVASWQKVIIVGVSDFGTGWLVLPRPIKLTSILGMLDSLAKESEQDATPAFVKSAFQEPVQVAPERVQASFAEIFSNSKADIANSATITDQSKEIVPITISPVSLDDAPSFVPSISGKINHEGSTTLGQEKSADRATLGHVLIVDDSDIALKYMQNRLRHFGYESELARSGDEALAMVANQSYQFVFLDVMMQGLDGYQTCRAIKNNKARRGPPPIVVMLTSRGGTIDKIRGTMAGCDAYMTKPLNEKQLTAVLAKFDQTTMTQRYEANHKNSRILNAATPELRQVNDSGQ